MHTYIYHIKRNKKKLWLQKKKKINAFVKFIMSAVLLKIHAAEWCACVCVYIIVSSIFFSVYLGLIRDTLLFIFRSFKIFKCPIDLHKGIRSEDLFRSFVYGARRSESIQHNQFVVSVAGRPLGGSFRFYGAVKPLIVNGMNERYDR